MTAKDLTTPPAGLQAPTKGLLSWLGRNPGFRAQIKAPPNQTVAYCGDFSGQAAFLRLLRLQLQDPRTNDFVTLNNVMKRLAVPQDLFKAVGLVTPPGVRTLADLVGHLTGEAGPAKVPWQPDGFVIWRALSGILMQQATGRVRLLIGDAPAPGEKVFYKTEMFVLDRNPHIDPWSRGAVQALRAQITAKSIPGRVEML